jgi:hypothetical protein
MTMPEPESGYHKAATESKQGTAAHLTIFRPISFKEVDRYSSIKEFSRVTVWN